MLSRTNAILTKFIFSKFQGVENLSTKEFEFDQGNRIAVVSTKVGAGSEALYVLAALPTIGKDIYLMFSDGDVAELREELGGIQNYNEYKEHLCLFHTIPTERPYFKKWGWSRHLIVKPLTILDRFPDACDAEGEEYRLRLVVPISEREFEIKASAGMEGLLDLFDSENRDLVTFEQNIA